MTFFYDLFVIICICKRIKYYGIQEYNEKYNQMLYNSFYPSMLVVQGLKGYFLFMAELFIYKICIISA